MWTDPKLAINCVAFDSEAKEHVLITNGKCTLDHSSPEAFRASHVRDGKTCDCVYAPSEAIAIRVLGKDDKGELLVAWTYRAVKPNMLTSSTMSKESFNSMLQGAKLKKDRTHRMIGRV